MKINERKRNNNNLRKIILLDNEGNQGTPQNVIIEEVEGNVTADGTPLTSELFDEINWKDNSKVEFKNLGNNELPQAVEGRTQIVAKQNGELWIIPKLSQGLSPFKVITALEPCILGVVEEESIEGRAFNTGLKVNSDKKLVLEKAGAVSENGITGQFGSVVVKTNNGLTIEEGVLGINNATSSTSGALSASDKAFIDNINGSIEVNDFNEAIQQGVYRGTSALNAPTLEKYLCFTSVCTNIVNQRLINVNTGSVYVRRRVNGNWTQYKLSDKEGVLLYDSIISIGSNTTIQLGMDLYNEGFKKVKITMYNFIDDSDDENTILYYDGNFSKEIILHEYNNGLNYSTRISFYEVIYIDNSYLDYITGEVKGNAISLSSFEKRTSGLVTKQGNYRVIIEAFK